MCADRFRAQIGYEPFVLYVGSVEPRKNLATLVNAFAMLPKKSAARHGLTDKVLLLGFVTDVELIDLYDTCTVFCYQTLYEGLGLPVIEAMSCGAPVITSRVAS